MVTLLVPTCPKPYIMGIPGNTFLGSLGNVRAMPNYVKLAVPRTGAPSDHPPSFPRKPRFISRGGALSPALGLRNLYTLNSTSYGRLRFQKGA